MPKTSSIRSAVSIEHRLVTDRRTQAMASTADPQHRAVKTERLCRTKVRPYTSNKLQYLIIHRQRTSEK